MKIGFEIRTKRKVKEGDMIPLHIRLVDGRAFHQGVKTQTFVNPLLWDDKKECIKNRALCYEEMRQKVTREINSLRLYIFDSYNEDKKKGKTDVPNWLAKAVDKFYAADGDKCGSS